LKQFTGNEAFDFREVGLRREDMERDIGSERR
jgi:hypothetical protein